ncbi:hypothetical protein TRFO_10793 [Tritrichomonas foetus]|uniref:Myb-like DNA-binding domain containing protein n=1 Tax=Tritrichomonas foetus TaxID=1144522 RepID=A0A1J4J6L3_9EUKA|nr:hypothetical protein TRFO_10793 [Tritrichomonas foetus]|eukprot:OHS94870.1 hypothetical protein TRFO_10793 [Tritrichomonas foetus]
MKQTGTAPKTGKPHPKVKFSPEEDFHLRAIILRFGDHDWNLIASLMKDRNPRQCRERWLKYLAPNVRFEPWSPEEDKQLERLVHDFGQKWVKISRFFRNRTDINVKNRWLVLQRQKAKNSVDVQKSPSSPSTLPSFSNFTTNTSTVTVNVTPNINQGTPSFGTTASPDSPPAVSNNFSPIVSPSTVSFNETQNASISFNSPIVEPIISFPSPPQIPMPMISPIAKKDDESILSLLESNNLDMEIWDGLVPPPVIDFESPIDSLSIPWY